MTEALVFDIQRFSLHDGPGIRTLVFLKGCSLRCVWCANPEGISNKVEMRYNKKKCVGCGRCVEVCPIPQATVFVPEEGFFINHELCNACGDCVKACPKRAKTLWGEKMTPSEIVRKVKRDGVFYDTSGGGLTLGGGEPLFQPQAAYEILKLAKEEGLNTAIETCGQYAYPNLERVVPYLDTIHYDIKGWDPKVHKALVGGDIDRIKSNLVSLNKTLGEMDNPPNLIVRIPTLPEFNLRKEEFHYLAAFLAPLKNARKIQLLPFHNFGTVKYESAGKPYMLKDWKNIRGGDLQEYLDILLSYNLPAEIQNW